MGYESRAIWDDKWHGCKNELDENDKMMLFMGAFNGVFSDENIEEAKEFKAKDS